MFVNRQKELQLLNMEYQNQDFRFTIIYGRRRVGKTTLLKEYISSKSYIYFLVTLEALPIILQRFQRLVADFLKDELLRGIELKSFEQIFEYLAKQNLSKKVIVVIDEFQYLGKLDKSIPSQFQYIVDEILKNRNIHLVLCGSIISMMYAQTLSYNSPLYGRRTSSIKLNALTFEYLSDFFPTKNEIELIELYAVLYGVPKYLELFRDSGTIFEAIERNILDKRAFLYEEPRFILQNEVNEPMTYFSILETIANGEHKLGNIAGKLNKNVQNITSFISKLIELEIIYKEVPITEKYPNKSKRGLYFIKDNFFRFWFSYVLPYKSQLELGHSSYAMAKIKENFSGFVAKVYEDLAIEYTLKNYPILKAGRWWSRDTEIDVVGVGEDFILVGECKYSNKRVGIDILEQLETKSKRIESNLSIKYYLLFSKSGFTKELLELQKKRDDIVLIDSFKT
ncbi:MAG: ATP-binding protein [Epsilonproteobacteria bacterium]|nr:ATP-binding protein [Campylobacterota bacterium]